MDQHTLLSAIHTNLSPPPLPSPIPQSHPSIDTVFWVGLGLWLALSLLPIHVLAPRLWRRRPGASTRPQDSPWPTHSDAAAPRYSATLGRGQRGGVEDTYMPSVPDACPAELSSTLHTLFRPIGYPERPSAAVQHVVRESPARVPVLNLGSASRAGSSSLTPAGSATYARVSPGIAPAWAGGASLPTPVGSGSFLVSVPISARSSGAGRLASDTLSPLRSAAQSRTHVLRQEHG